ncbi:unnamed protein product [Auanema sp. JU1783]|nr:unnamed protein product [Auanema sp. JU1783]
MTNGVNLNKIKDNIAKTKKLEQTLGSDIQYTMAMIDSDDEENESLNNASTPSKLTSMHLSKFNDAVSRANTLLADDSGEKVTISATFRKLNFICSNEFHYAIHSLDDAERYINQAQSTHVDLWLNSTGHFPMHDIFDRAMASVVHARNIAEHSGKGPDLNLCLAWIAYACQGQIGDIVPPGEQFPASVQYIARKLRWCELPKVANKERVNLAICQISRVFEFISVCNLCNQSTEDRAILLFSVSRIILDKSMEAHIQFKAIDVIANIINANSLNRRSVIVDFSRLFCLLSDDFCALRFVFECFRLAPIPPYALLCLVGTAFISASERAECEPDFNEAMTDDELIDAYFSVITETFVDAMEVFANAKMNQSALLNMLDAALVKDLFVLDHAKGSRRLDEISKVTEPLTAKLYERKGNPDEAMFRYLSNRTVSRSTSSSQPIGQLISASPLLSNLFLPALNHQSP